MRLFVFSGQIKSTALALFKDAILLLATEWRKATAANRWNFAAALSCSSGVIKPGSKYKRVKSKLSDFVHRPVILSQQGSAAELGEESRSSQFYR